MRWAHPILDALFNDESCSPSKSLTAARQRIVLADRIYVIFLPPLRALNQVPSEKIFQDSYLLSHVAEFTGATMQSGCFVEIHNDFVQLAKGFPSARRVNIRHAELLTGSMHIFLVHLDDLLHLQEGASSRFSGIFGRSRPVQSTSKNTECLVEPEYPVPDIMKQAADAHDLARKYHSLILEDYSNAERNMGPYVFEKLVSYEWAIPPVSELQSQLYDLDLSQIDIPPIHNYWLYEQAISRASGELNKLSVCPRTPTAVGGIFLRTLEILASPELGAVSADTLLGLFVLVLLRARQAAPLIEPAHFFVSHFGVLSSSGKLAYALLVVESVLMHLRSEHERLLRLCLGNRNARQSLDPFDEASLAAAAATDQSILRARYQGKSLLFQSLDKPLALRYLLQYHLDTNYVLSDRDSNRRTLLLAALDKGNSECIDIIVEKLMDTVAPETLSEYLREPSLDGRTSAHATTDKEVKRLGDYFDWTTKDRNEETPVLSAVRRSLDVQNIFSHDCGSFYDHIALDGSSLIHISSDNISMLGEVLKLPDIDVNWRNNVGQTALMIALEKDNLECMSLLLQKNTDIWLEDHSHRRAVDYCRTIWSRQRLMDESSIQFAVPQILPGVNDEFLAGPNLVLHKYSDFDDLRRLVRGESPSTFVPVLGCGFVQPDKLPWGLNYVLGLAYSFRLDLFMRCFPLNGSREFISYRKFLAEPTDDISFVNTAEPHIERGSIPSLVTFFTYSSDNVSSVVASLNHLTRTFARVHRALKGSQDLEIELWSFLDATGLHPNIPKLLKLALKEFGVSPESEISIWLLSTLKSSTESLLVSLQTPLQLVRELGEAEGEVSQYRQRLHQLADARPWLGVFEEKRQHDISRTEESVAAGLHRVKKIGRKIANSHVTLATELSSFTSFQAEETISIIRNYSWSRIRTETDTLQRLRRSLSELRNQRTMFV